MSFEGVILQYITIYPTKSGKWRAEVRFADFRKTKVCGSEKEAKLWAARTERDVLLNDATFRALNAEVVITLSEALRRYAEQKSILKKTARKEVQRIAYFQANLPNVDWPLAKYRDDFIAQYRDEVMNRAVRPLSAGSVLRDFSILSAVFSWCVEKKWIDKNPMLTVKKPSKPAHRERRIEDDEFKKILVELKYSIGDVPQTKSAQVALIWLIAVATGMRSGEIVNCRLSDVDLKNSIVILHDTKNGTRRIVPLDHTAHYFWSLALRIERNDSWQGRVFSVTDGSRDTLFRKARKMAGLANSGLRFHDSRHEAASQMAKRLKNPLTLCKVFGWRDPKFALVYYNPTQQEIIQELNQSENGFAQHITPLSKLDVTAVTQ